MDSLTAPRKRARTDPEAHRLLLTPKSQYPSILGQVASPGCHNGGALFKYFCSAKGHFTREKSPACAGWKTFPQPGAYVLKSVRAPLAGGMDMSIFDKLYDKALDEPEGSVKRNVAVALSGFADWFGATVDEIRGHRKGLGHGPDSDPRAEPADYKLYAAGTITADMKEYLLARMASRRNLAALSYLINADYAVRLGNMAAEYIRKKRKGEDAHIGDLPAVGLVGTVRSLAGKLRGGKATAAPSGADDEPEFSILPAEEPLGLE